jgi:nucleotide-binding universal stress UspA family protein
MSTGARFTVLVPLDGSRIAEAAIPVARTIAGADGSLLLMHVVTTPEWYDHVKVLEEPEMAGAVLDTAGEHARHHLIETAARWGGAPPNMGVCIARGDPAEEIVRAAETEEADFIAMASHGRGALGRWRFGSVADRVVRSAGIPTLLVRTEAEASIEGRIGFERVVVPYDGSELAAQALPTATALAKRLQLPVRVVRVVDAAGVLGGSSIGLPVPDEAFERMQEELESSARQSLEPLVETLQREGLTAEGAVYLGPPSPTLLDAVTPGDLVVMTSHGRSGVRRWVLGSVAEKLVRLGEAPVVLVPAGPDRA